MISLVTSFHLELVEKKSSQKDIVSFYKVIDDQHRNHINVLYDEQMAIDKKFQFSELVTEILLGNKLQYTEKILLYVQSKINTLLHEANYQGYLMRGSMPHSPGTVLLDNTLYEETLKIKEEKKIW